MKNNRTGSQNLLVMLMNLKISGGYGGASSERTNRGARMAVCNVCGVHDRSRLGAYFRPHDQHVLVTERRGNK